MNDREATFPEAVDFRVPDDVPVGVERPDRNVPDIVASGDVTEVLLVEVALVVVEPTGVREEVVDAALFVNLVEFGVDGGDVGATFGGDAAFLLHRLGIGGAVTVGVPGIHVGHQVAAVAFVRVDARNQVAGVPKLAVDEVILVAKPARIGERPHVGLIDTGQNIVAGTDQLMVRIGQEAELPIRRKLAGVGARVGTDLVAVLDRSHQHGPQVIGHLARGTDEEGRLDVIAVQRPDGVRNLGARIVCRVSDDGLRGVEIFRQAHVADGVVRPWRANLVLGDSEAL